MLCDAAAILRADPVPRDEIAATHGTPAPGTVSRLLAAPCLLPLIGVGTALGLGLVFRGRVCALVGAATGALALISTSALALVAWQSGSAWW